jgi:hypothetical protein
VSGSDYVDGTYGSPDGEYEFVGYTRYIPHHTSGTGGDPIDYVNFRETDEIVNGEGVLRDGSNEWAIWYLLSSDKMIITPVANIGGALPADYWLHNDTGTVITGSYNGLFAYANMSVKDSLGYPWWETANGDFSIVGPDDDENEGSILVPTDQYELRPRGSLTPIYFNDTGANPTGWNYGIDPIHIELGRNPINQTQTSESFAGSAELEFESVIGGTIPDPIVGEIKTISNVPNGDGTFRSTVVTVTANPQRFPPSLGVFQFESREGATLKNSTISAKNKNEADLARDAEFLDALNAAWSNSISSSINKFGLIDYNITSFYTG